MRSVRPMWRALTQLTAIGPMRLLQAMLRTPWPRRALRCWGSTHGVAMWVLAVASLITVGQRVHAVRTSPGATDFIERPDEGSAPR